MSHCRDPCKKEKKCKPKCRDHEHPVVYGEFIRTFTFETGVALPIVQPGGSVVFPTATVTPHGVKYVDEPGRVGLLVPRGTYLVSWRLNPSAGASVNLLVNGVSPLTVGTPTFPYTQSVTTTVLDVEYLVKAPNKKNNLISLVNGGNALFTLNNLPNTTIGLTSVLTQVRVQSLKLK